MFLYLLQLLIVGVRRVRETQKIDQQHQVLRRPLQRCHQQGLELLILTVYKSVELFPQVSLFLRCCLDAYKDRASWASYY